MGNPRSRVVRPDQATLQISGGDWLLVKKRLTHGEVAEASALRYEADPDHPGMHRTNIRLIGLVPVLIYLLDWSLVDLDGVVIPIRGKSPIEIAQALDSLDDESVDEIKAAILAHEQAMDAERAAVKNGQDGANESSAISPSPNTTAGATNGSTRSTAMSTP